ncbi:MAG: RNA polymerase factor sigma-54 [Chlamydiota bacterium]
MLQKPALRSNLKPDQRLAMSHALEQALSALQLPILQLASWVEQEVEKNPVLDIVSSPTAKKVEDFPISSKPTRYEYLQREIFYSFKTKQERDIATYIAGCLDDKGFLTLSDQEICLEKKISKSFLHKILQQFYHIEPIGMAARNAQEALLVQLKIKNQRHSLIYQVVRDYFPDLLHNRLALIAKKMSLSVSTLKSLIHEKLKPLDPFPGQRFSTPYNPSVTPDLILKKEAGIWQIEVNHTYLPRFSISPQYDLKTHRFSKEERLFLRRYFAAGKWLTRILHRRHNILFALGTYLIKRQYLFLDGSSCSPTPMTMRQVAQALELNESTITRAIANKYLSSPVGILKIRDLFSQHLRTTTGKTSNQRVKKLLSQLIDKEDKQSPHSDQSLSKNLIKQGIFCSRRTVAKYRKQLHIPPSIKRKE